MTDQLEYYVGIDPELPSRLEGPVVAFGAFHSDHPGACIYGGPTIQALSHFYVDLIVGRPIPLQFVVRSLEDLATVTAIALFLDRTLAMSPKIGGFLAAVEMSSILQAAGLAHIDRDLARFLTFVDHYMFGTPSSKRDLETKLTAAIHWIREYILEDRLPSLPPEKTPPTILDTGTNGFVLAEAQPDGLFHSVIELYRAGHLRGVVRQPSGQSLAFRKSHHLKFDLEKAQALLEPIESGWKVLPGSLYLVSPPVSAIEWKDQVEIFLRV